MNASTVVLTEREEAAARLVAAKDDFPSLVEARLFFANLPACMVDYRNRVDWFLDQCIGGAHYAAVLAPESSMAGIHMRPVGASLAGWRPPPPAARSRSPRRVEAAEEPATLRRGKMNSKQWRRARLAWEAANPGCPRFGNGT
mmetsp:Transcript_129233/g.294884  ORF Transcript_129233/g.294884 Transcript_129233/m.294884 type:complete len:143 (-) Transcript_129233:132-560(-)